MKTNTNNHTNIAGALTLVLSMVAGSGCAGTSGPGGGFDLHFPDNRPADVGAITAALASRAAEPIRPIVVVTSAPPARGMTAFSLPDGRRLWQTATQIDARPTIIGDLVVSHAAGQVHAWDAQSGAEKWHVSDHGFSLIGAGGDRAHVAISLGPGGLNNHHGMFLVVDANTGATRVESAVDQALGTPTAAGGYAFVPWNGQYLSIFDIGRGNERARIRSTDDVFSRADHEGNAVYFGARALYRMAAESGSGHRQGAPTYVLSRDDLPGNPPLLTDGYTPAYAGINARERVTVVSRPDPAQPGAKMLNGLVFSVFHRVVFAIDATDGAVKWAYVHSADITGSEPVAAGLVFGDERGNAGMLDARAGNLVWTQRLGESGAQAIFGLPLDFAPPHVNEEPPQPPTTTLVAAAGGTDNRMLPARLFAARALGGMPGPEATRGLLAIAGRPGYPHELTAAAGEALATRREGTDALLEGLSTHYSYLRQTNAPPVGYIARALATAHEARGVAPLIAHLRDPETPAVELPPLVAALKDFRDATAVPALLDFVRLYHSDDGAVPPVTGGDPINDRSGAEQEAMNAALELAIQAIAQLGGPPERRWLQAMVADRNTIIPVRNALERALAAEGAQAGGGGDASTGTAATGAAATQPADSDAIDPNIPPPRLSMGMIQNAMAAVRDDLMHCIDGATSRPAQVRIQFRYDSAGTISSVVVTPAQFGACMSTIVSGIHLPPSQVSREIGTYYLIGGPL